MDRLDVVDEEDVEVEVEGVREGVGRSFPGFLDQRGRGLRVCFWVVFSEDAADEEEEDEKAKEKRDGDPGSPMRMAVPFEAAESGRGPSGESGGLSFSGVSCSWAGFFLRAVRPPDGRCVRLGAVGWTAGATVARVQRSGAE